MIACASNELARVEAEMDDVCFQKPNLRPEALAKIKSVQKAWLVYRDAYIAAMYPAKNKQAEYGSVYESKLAPRQAHTKASGRPKKSCSANPPTSPGSKGTRSTVLLDRP
jgi:uncharacterized protein YecT (DUF1311 family)